jgi:hypothetical protein
MARLNGLIKRALEMPVPASVNAPIHALGHAHESKLPRRMQPRWFAMAASILVGIGLVIGVLSLTAPRESLANVVVAHLAHEPGAWTPTQARVSTELLEGALRAKGLQLSQPMNDVSYVQSCEIRGHLVPHLVVQTDRGPVTVLLLTEEKIANTERFDERQYHGVLVPMARGALAVIALDASVVDSVAEKIKSTVSIP